VTFYNNMLPFKDTDATLECFKDGRQSA